MKWFLILVFISLSSPLTASSICGYLADSHTLIEESSGDHLKLEIDKGEPPKYDSKYYAIWDKIKKVEQQAVCIHQFTILSDNNEILITAESQFNIQPVLNLKANHCEVFIDKLVSYEQYSRFKSHYMSFYLKNLDNGWINGSPIVGVGVHYQKGDFKETRNYYAKHRQINTPDYHNLQFSVSSYNWYDSPCNTRVAFYVETLSRVRYWTSDYGEEVNLCYPLYQASYDPNFYYNHPLDQVSKTAESNNDLIKNLNPQKCW